MMKKLIVIALLLITNTVFGLKYNPDGTLALDIDWYMKDIHADVYEISNANELAGFAALVNGTSGVFSSFSFTGKQVVLSKDIDMEGSVDADGQSHGPVWIPIGTHFSCRFEGEFDGQGHCIKNFISSGGVSGTLFGYNGGVIRNLVIAGGMVNTQYYGAGICSHNSGLVEYCINTANIICANYGGGICGKNYDNGRISNCINLGYVQPGNQCGAIVGSSATGSTVMSCIYDIQMCPLKKGCGNGDLRGIQGLSTSQVMSAQGLDAEMFVQEEGMYPRLSVSEQSPAIRAALYPLMLPQQENVGNVVQDIQLGAPKDVSFSSPASPHYLEISGNVCKLKAKACAPLEVKGGGVVRIINLKLKNATLDFVGTRNAPIKISTPQDLKCLANAVNCNSHYKGFANIDGFKDVEFVLAENIHMPTGSNWTPIGTETAPFCGNFNGQGLAISNLFIKCPFDNYVGLFGYCKGNISRLVIVGGLVVGGDYTGTICGYTTGEVESCLTAVSVRGHYYTGGVVGFAHGAKILDCIHVNTVTGYPGSYGAVCGNAVSGSVKNCAFDRQICPGMAAIGATDQTQVLNVDGYYTTDMVGSRLASAKDAYKNFYMEENMYPSPISIKRGIESRVASTPVFVADGEDVYHIKSYIELNNVMDISYHCGQEEMLRITPDKAWPQKQGAVNFTVSGGDVDKEITVKIVNRLLDPLGSEQSPLEIASYKDLDKFRKAVNYGTDYKGYACIDGFKDVYFILSSNIYCPQDEEQMPIGNSMFPFAGNFEGNHKTIYGFECMLPERDNVGMFGYSSGRINGVRVAKARIQGRYYTGGICGYNVGSLTQCSLDSSKVMGTNYAGGICGYTGGVLEKCTNLGTVACDYYAGGIAGNSVGRVDTCVNLGTISGTSCIGGISGSNNDTITHSFNFGNIKGVDNVGGMSGRNSYSHIVNCHNRGKIDGGDCSGGIVGLNDGSVMYCLNDSTVGGTLSVGGIAGKGGVVKACINNGPVASSGNNAGGIMGLSKANVIIERCLNNGPVKAETASGGICSDNKSGSSIIGCANYGDVDGTNNVGGVCGGNNGDVKSCMVACKIHGNSYVGAICGREYNSSNIERCVYDKVLSLYGAIQNAENTAKAVGLATNMMQEHKVLVDKIDMSLFVHENGSYAKPDMNLEK
ncbi:MAG: hypothetical protein MJZ66_06520 [Bacteroidales bacterium]|nr:hypothetical protein [Bacteroidales bacterium]